MERAFARFGLDRAVGEDLVIGPGRRIAADDARRPLRLFWRLEGGFDRLERRQVTGAIDVDRAFVFGARALRPRSPACPLQLLAAGRRSLRPMWFRPRASPQSRAEGRRSIGLPDELREPPIRQIRTPMANVTTAAQAATAPARAYKTPRLVGKRSMLSYPPAAAAISKMRLRTKIRIDIRPSTPTCRRNLIRSAVYLERACRPIRVSMR